MLGLGGITYAIIEVPDKGAGSPQVLAAAVVGVAAMVGFVLAEWRQPHPMLPLSLFRSRQFSAANAVTFVVYGAFGGIFFLLAVAAAGRQRATARSRPASRSCRSPS